VPLGCDNMSRDPATAFMRNMAPMFMRALLFLAAASLMLVACGEDESGDRPTCLLIGETCHDFPSDEAQECHELGEAESSTEEQCAEREEECLALCK